MKKLRGRSAGRISGLNRAFVLLLVSLSLGGMAIHAAAFASATATATISPSSLPGGMVGATYSQTISASGPNPPYTLRVTQGALPPGLSLSASSSSAATLAGTPSAAGSYAFTISAFDPSGAYVGFRDYTIAVATASGSGGTHVALTNSLKTFSQPTRYTVATLNSTTRIDTTQVQCHGGSVHVTWYVGDLEPTVANTGIHLDVYMNTKVITTIEKGGDSGNYNDGPATAETVVSCPSGTQTFSVGASSIDASWGIPYADPGTSVQRGFIVEEVF
jgi:Putative Ig domain